ncbi:MAG: universal stress protein [Rhodospirillales bacterium]|nr:universal stress protein [Rhodospirillales bacterium]
MKARRILLASHGTPGAKAAETAAFALCEPGGHIHHLIVVPDFWKGMLGDDWLNNAAVHVRFGRYVEGQLEREIVAHAETVAAEAKRRGLEYDCELRFGKPADCLVAAAGKEIFDLAVVGSPRPKGVAGLRSRMDMDVLAKNLMVPLVLVPHPVRDGGSRNDMG